MTDYRRDLMLASERGEVALRILVIREWWDGPVDGILRATYGVDRDQCFRFRLAAQIARSDDIDDRLYELTAIDDDRMRVLGLNADAAMPLVWPYDEHPDVKRFEVEIGRLMDEATAASVLLESGDLVTVRRVWFVARHPSDCPGR